MTCPLTATDEKMKQMAEPLQEFNKEELITMMVGMGLENEKLKEENKKYFDENQKYKEENTEYRVKYEHKDNDYTQMKQLKSAYGQQKAILKKENKKLKDEIEEFNSQIQEYENTEADDIQEIKELTEIKDAIALHCCCETDTRTTMEYTHALIKDINKLKALVKDLGII